jgi:hypothetical protein
MYKIFPALLLSFLFSCSSEKDSESTDSKTEEKTELTETTDSNFVIPELKSLMPHMADFNKGKVDISKIKIEDLSLVECRIYRNHFLATKGYVFMKAELRAFFSATDYYDKLIWDMYEYDKEPNLSFSKEEQEFIDKLKTRENQLRKQNFIDNKANIGNIVNLYQFTDIKPKFLEAIAKNGFVITAGNEEQLFHVYENNDYRQVPNFITTDIYLQLYHMYFSYVLKSIEKESFIPALNTICLNQYEYFLGERDDYTGEMKAKMAKNAAFYKIAYDLVCSPDQVMDTDEEIESIVNTEVKLILEASSGESPFMNGSSVDYSLYKPRGHYTRKEEMQRYFRAMMWLQNAFYCGATKMNQVDDIMLHAIALKMNPAALAEFKKMDEPLTYIFGQQDNLSMLDVLNEMENSGINTLQGVIDADKKAWSKKIEKMYSKKNKIKSGNEDCFKVNFIPQRYLADNDILQNLVDNTNKPSQRCFPQGLDMFAAFGNENAKNILMNELKEGESWDKYEQNLEEQTKKFSKKNDWSKTIYDSWIKMLVDMDNKNDKYQPFMNTPQWSKKNLYTGLASWAELKHDAILYGEQPMAAECGGGGPPDPYTLGYVEPNLVFWKSLLGVSNKTKMILENNGLYNEDVAGKTKEIIESIEFMVQVSKKELAGKKLSQREYETIEYIGSTIEWLTLSVLDPDLELDSWNLVQGPDKSVAVVADIYTNNNRKCEQQGILHVATGLVNEIYVLVEIEGLLYLTKGATLSYHEFQRALNDRLTDETWQKMLHNGERPGIPSWIQEIMFDDGIPKANEKIFYSSGC